MVDPTATKYLAPRRRGPYPLGSEDCGLPLATRPDIVLQLPDRRRLLIEVTVCSDSLVVTRQSEKTAKYHPLSQALASAEQVPHPQVVTGVVPDDVLLSVRALETAGIPLRLSTLQRAAAFGSARIVRKLMATGVKTQ